MNHEWVCDGCGEIIAFRRPELPEDLPASEMNEDKRCPECGTDMYFVDASPVGELVTPKDAGQA